MKDLSFEELVKIVNEEGITIRDYCTGEEAESADFNSITHSVRNKVEEVLERYGFSRDAIRVSDYNGKVYLYQTYRVSNRRYGYGSNEPDGIFIRIKKKMDKTLKYSYSQKYFFAGIEMDDEINYMGKEIKTIQEYIDIENKALRDNEILQKNRKEKFVKYLEEHNMEYEDFIEMYNKYRALDYNRKIELAKRTAEKHNTTAYYKYMVN